MPGIMGLVLRLPNARCSSFLFCEVKIIITIYYYTFYQFGCIATSNMWNGIEKIIKPFDARNDRHYF